MNEQKIAVLIDSGCDVPAPMREKYGIHVLPLHLVYPEKDYLDGVDIDPLMTYERFPEEFPKTSTPSIHEAVNCLEAIKAEGYKKIIAVTISSGLSSTCNAIRLAAEEVEDLEVYVFDTKNISIGSGLFAIWAATKRNEGTSFEEIVQGLNERIHDSKVFFYMDTLKYLQRGGRIGKIAGFLGEAIKLRPLISCDDEGKYYTVAKIRGSKFAKQRLFEELYKYCEGHKTWIVVEEGGAHEEAMIMQGMIEEKFTDKEILFEQQITATMAVNTGPGLVGVGAFRL